MKRFVVSCLTTVFSLAISVNAKAETVYAPTYEPPYEVVSVALETEVPSELVSEIELPNEKEYRYIKDCPLSNEIQEGIFDICEENNISFEFVMSVIFQESSFRPDALGDNCESKGLMQIQTKWHSELMQELGVTDLFDPLQNVKVGVALLCQYFEEIPDAYYVLMKYNGGHSYAKRMLENGKVSDYAVEITERAIAYERENGI
jgi:hypothetical protein